MNDQQQQPAAPAIPMTPVQSSQIAAIGYDAATKTLAIQFPSKSGSGSLYHYSNFTAKDYEDFVKAESKGSHFIRTIKANPKAFPYRKVA